MVLRTKSDSSLAGLLRRQKLTNRSDHDGQSTSSNDLGMLPLSNHSRRSSGTARRRGRKKDRIPSEVPVSGEGRHGASSRSQSQLRRQRSKEDLLQQLDPQAFLQVLERYGGTQDDRNKALDALSRSSNHRRKPPSRSKSRSSSSIRIS